MLSDELQTRIVHGDLHSPFEQLPPPEGAPSLSVLNQTKLQFSPEFLSRSYEGAESLRKRFSEIMGGT